jgi:hypothetical protein
MAGTLGEMQMTTGFRTAWLLFFLSFTSVSGAAIAAPKAKPKPPAAAPGTPETGWFLGRDKDRLRLFYGMADGTGTVIVFSCAPRSGDVVIHLPLPAPTSRPDQAQSLSLTLGGVRSSFAGSVAENLDGTTALEVTVTARNPMFVSLAGPGGMRIETKGSTKIVPLRGIGDKLKQFLGSCRK